MIDDCSCGWLMSFNGELIEDEDGIVGFCEEGVIPWDMGGVEGFRDFCCFDIIVCLNNMCVLGSKLCKIKIILIITTR
jgi:hypothetical protein